MDEYSNLQCLNSLDILEVKSLIQEIKNAENQLYFDESPLLNGVEIDFNPPNVTIEGMLTIPMFDFKELLIEWLDFISENEMNN